MTGENGNASPAPGSSTPKKPAPADGEGRLSRWGKAGFQKSIKISDWISPYANKVSAAVGGERFWPQSNDMVLEIEKCERIIRAFTVEGVQQKETKIEKVQDENGNWIQKKVKVLRKVPPAAIRNAKGIAIFSSMRSGIAPLGGGGGSGLFLARLPDGSWSAPTAISPQSGAVGLLLGIDFIDVILLINSEKTLETFKSFRVDLGAEAGLTAGPYGSGYSAEASYDRAPVYSYVRNRGAYAGIEFLGQLFLQRFDENERFYFWPGVTAREILEGKVRIPPSVYPLHRALRDAETGRAQGGKLERTEYDIIKIPESEVFKQLGPNGTNANRKKRFVPHDATTPTAETPTPLSTSTYGANDDSAVQTPKAERDSLEELDLEEAAREAERKLQAENGIADDEEAEDEQSVEIVQEGERLRLPPTPAELEMMEAAGIPDEEDIRVEKEDRIKIYQLPAPPLHPDVRQYWNEKPGQFANRPTHQLLMDGPNSPEVRIAQFVSLPPSPKEEVSEHELFDQYGMSRKGADGMPNMREENQHAEYTLDGQPFQAESTDVQGEVLASGIEEEEAEKVMEAALHGEIDEAKRIGQEAEIEKEEKFEKGTPDQLQEEANEQNHVEQIERSSGEIQDEASVNSHAQSFASMGSMNGEEVTLEDAANQDIQVEGNITNDTVVNSTLNDDNKSKLNEEEVHQITPDPVSSRPSTPTDVLQSTDSDMASGTATPLTGVNEENAVKSGGAKSTPTRPPRRKRPSKKGN